MAWCVDEADAVFGLLEELLAGGHRLEDSGLSFDAEVVRDPTSLGDQLDEGLGLVSVELVEHEDPGCIRVGVDGRSDVGSFRVGPMLGTMAVPVATSKFAMRQSVP